MENDECRGVVEGQGRVQGPGRSKGGGARTQILMRLHEVWGFLHRKGSASIRVLSAAMAAVMGGRTVSEETGVIHAADQLLLRPSIRRRQYSGSQLSVTTDCHGGY